MAAEVAGVPSVSIVCAGFERQAQATARGHGFDHLALAVTDGHVDAQSDGELIERFTASTVNQIIAGLTGGMGESPAAGAAEEPGALDTVASGSIDEINQFFVARGWSEGLPVIPPTRERVAAFLAPSGHDPWRSLGTAKSSGRDLTVWSVAVNAVMAGCDPRHLPILLAAAEILADPAYGAEHSGNTTGADALIILDGPSAAELGFNAGPGALREGAAANTSVGRWLRLYLRNVFDFTAEEHDKATFGNSTRVVLTEDAATLAEIGWAPLSADFGFEAADDVIVMARFNSGIIVGSVFGATPAQILPYLADGLARVTGWDLTHLHGLGHHHYRPLLVLSPLLARVFTRAGWSRDRVREALFEQARIPAWRFEKLIGEWSNLTAGRPSLTTLVAAGHLPPVFAASADPERLVPVVVDPSHLLLAVAGDPNRANAYVLANDGPHGWWTARRINHGPSLDLACRIENQDCTSPTVSGPGASAPGQSIGPVVAVGSRSVIHQWGERTVAKVPKPGIPASWIPHEAQITRAVWSLGVPAHRCHGVEDLDGTLVGIYDWVDGPNLWHQIEAEPAGGTAQGELLGRLHAEILAVTPPVALPRQADRLRCKLRPACASFGLDLAEVLGALPPPGSGLRLCHGDFHPGNIIVSTDGPLVVVDWFDASRGPVVCDIARTSILLGAGLDDTAQVEHLPGHTAERLRQVHDAYLSTVCALTGTEPAAVIRWRRVEAVARLAEGVHPDALLALWRWAPPE
jgi:Phosphotransferase enzyme family